MIATYFATGTLLILILLYIAVVLFFASANKLRPLLLAQEYGRFSLSEISVVVPFNNEAANLARILDNLPVDELAAVWLVDDHSTDGSLAVARELASSRPHCQVLSAGEPGKKWAIQKGVSAADSNLILTLDADVGIGSAFWRKLENMPPGKNEKLWICPIKMNPANDLPARLQYMEWMALEGVKRASQQKRFPLLANGAALLFTRSAFLEADSRRSDYDTRSGDDIFLLHTIISMYGPSAAGWLDMREASPHVSPAGNLPEMFSQRIRWASKNHRVGSFRYGSVALIFLLANIAGGVCLLGGFLYPSYAVLLLGLYLFKCAADFLLVCKVERYFSQNLAPARFWLPALLYPFLVVSIALYLPFAQSGGNWKTILKSGKYA